MTLPGKLTEKHIEAAYNRGDKTMIYKHQTLDVDKLWKQIQQEKKGGGSVHRHIGLSEEPKKNKNVRKPDTDSSTGNSTE